MDKSLKHIDRILILVSQGKKLLDAINKLGEDKVKILDDESSNLDAVLVQIDPSALEGLKTMFPDLEIEEVHQYFPVKS